MAELWCHLADLHLIYSIFRDLVNNLIHLNQQLSSNGEFSDNLRLFTDVVTLMRAEKHACGADTHPILYADDLNFAIMLLTVLHSETIFLRLGRRFFFLDLFNNRGLFSLLFCRSDLSL